MKTKNIPIIFLASKFVANANQIIMLELKKHGVVDISPSYGDIFHLLFDSKTMPMAQIAKQIHKTKATTSVLIDKLENLGYLTRQKCEQDGRVFYIKLTQKGENLKPITQQVSENLNKILYSNFSEFELKALETLLKKVLKNSKIS